jgi:hypothetical protein
LIDLLSSNWRSLNINLRPGSSGEPTGMPQRTHCAAPRQKATRAKRALPSPAPRPASFSESVRLFDILGEKQLGKKSALAHTLRSLCVYMYMCVWRCLAHCGRRLYQLPDTKVKSLFWSSSLEYMRATCKKQQSEKSEKSVVLWRIYNTKRKINVQQRGTFSVEFMTQNHEG